MLMATLRRIPVTWTGLTGLPGVSVFYAASAVDAAANIDTFLSAVATRFPNGLTWSCPASGDTIDDTTGHLNGTWTGGTVIVRSGAGGSSGYAAGVGVAVQWLTGGLVNSRRLKGRTFLCPLLASEFQSDGTIAAATMTAITNAANTLATAGVLQIWHRPSPGGSDGVSSVTVGASVPDRVTALRSRRY